jgi:hypothetical protein
MNRRISIIDRLIGDSTVRNGTTGDNGDNGGAKGKGDFLSGQEAWLGHLCGGESFPAATRLEI